MEKLLVQQLYDYLDANELLSRFQFGFRSGKSVDEQLLLCYDYVTRHFDLGDSVDVVFFDYKKAFDVVNHRILFAKLVQLGIGDPILGWLHSFLSDRSMKVVIHGESSHRVDVGSGVPQGSVVGPLLFLFILIS